MHSFTLPEFRMPYPPYATLEVMEVIERDMWRWCDSQGLLTSDSGREHLARARPQYATAMYYPFADAKHSLPINRYMAWAFIVDDSFDDAISTHNDQAVHTFADELIGISLGTGKPTSNAGHALRELWDDFTDDRSPGWAKTLGEVHEAWLRTYHIEARATRRGKGMPLGDYIAHRRYGVDELIFIHLQEYIRDIDLPTHIRDLPAMIQARHRDSEWVGLYNDVFSAEKEEAVGYMHNAVLIVREQLRCSMQEAADAVAVLTDGLLQQFEAACAAVPGQVRAVTDPTDLPGLMRDVEQVVEGYRHLIRGNFDYHVGTARYNDVADYLPGTQIDGLRPEWSTTGIHQRAATGKRLTT
jgi:(+)-beta-caryophyllene/(+)-caryolan-1-ol synthase